MMMDENVMFEQNVGLVKYIIKVKYKSTGQDYDDLYQEGCLGLLHAIRNFKPEYGYKFATYAVGCISGNINRYLRDKHYSTMNTPRHLRALYFKLQKMCTDLTDEKEVKLAAEKLEVDFETAKEAAKLIKVFQARSLDYEYNEGESTIRYVESISNGRDDYDHVDNLDVLQRAMVYLDETQKKLIYLYYVDELSQSQIGKLLNIRQVQVSRMLAKVKNQMKVAIEDNEVIQDKRIKTVIEYNGEKRSLAEWSKITGVKYSTLKQRLELGWDLDKAFA